MNLVDSNISTEQLIERLEWRYATKQYDPARKIDDSTWQALEEVLRLSPSSGGLQPWKFVVVNDPVLREKLVPASFGQTQVKDASHLVVFTAKKDFAEADVDAFIARTAEIRHTSVESLAGFRGMLLGGIVNGLDASARQAWAARQTYIALGNLLTSAALLGIDATPMEGFVPAQFDEILGLDKLGLTATVICALGFRSENDNYGRLPKVRFNKDEVFIRV